MSIEHKINALLAQAAPLRELDPIEAELAGLPALVDEINRLRSLKADAAEALDAAIEAAHEAEFAATAESVNPPKRGRPRKVQE